MREPKREDDLTGETRQFDSRDIEFELLVGLGL